MKQIIFSEYNIIPHLRGVFMKNYKIAVVGATGLVGRKIIEVLQEYELPISDCSFFASKRSAGTEIFFQMNLLILQFFLLEEMFLENLLHLQLKQDVLL